MQSRRPLCPAHRRIGGDTRPGALLRRGRRVRHATTWAVGTRAVDEFVNVPLVEHSVRGARIYDGRCRTPARQRRCGRSQRHRHEPVMGGRQSRTNARGRATIPYSITGTAHLEPECQRWRTQAPSCTASPAQRSDDASAVGHRTAQRIVFSDTIRLDVDGGERRESALHRQRPPCPHRCRQLVIGTARPVAFADRIVPAAAQIWTVKPEPATRCVTCSGARVPIRGKPV